jgi:hypothetical protein
MIIFNETFDVHTAENTLLYFIYLLLESIYCPSGLWPMPDIVQYGVIDGQRSNMQRVMQYIKEGIPKDSTIFRRLPKCRAPHAHSGSTDDEVLHGTVHPCAHCTADRVLPATAARGADLCLSPVGGDTGRWFGQALGFAVFG